LFGTSSNDSRQQVSLQLGAGRAGRSVSTHGNQYLFSSVFLISSAYVVAADLSGYPAPLLTLPQFALVFLWLGHPFSEYSVPAKLAVARARRLIQTEPEAQAFFEGLCSSAAAEWKIKNRILPCVYRLIEGRLERTEENERMYFIRNVVKTNASLKHELVFRDPPAFNALAVKAPEPSRVSKRRMSEELILPTSPLPLHVPTGLTSEGSPNSSSTLFPPFHFSNK
jgi:hypothetical protein